MRKLMTLGCNLVLLGMMIGVASCCLLMSGSVKANEPPTAQIVDYPPVAQVEALTPVRVQLPPVAIIASPTRESKSPLVPPVIIAPVAGNPASNAATRPINISAVSYRNPIGHTHTCPQCGDVWDHTKNPTHTCQVCGNQSWVQDAPAKMVTVRTASSVQPYISYPTYPLIQSSPLIQSNCPGGNCPLPSYRYR